MGASLGTDLGGDPLDLLRAPPPLGRRSSHYLSRPQKLVQRGALQAERDTTVLHRRESLRGLTPRAASPEDG
jgi:hypothetical protein